MDHKYDKYVQLTQLYPHNVLYKYKMQKYKILNTHIGGNALIQQQAKIIINKINAQNEHIKIVQNENNMLKTQNDELKMNAYYAKIYYICLYIISAAKASIHIIKIIHNGDVNSNKGIINKYVHDIKSNFEKIIYLTNNLINLTKPINKNFLQQQIHDPSDRAKKRIDAYENRKHIDLNAFNDMIDEIFASTDLIMKNTQSYVN